MLADRRAAEKGATREPFRPAFVSLDMSNHGEGVHSHGKENAMNRISTTVLAGLVLALACGSTAGAAVAADSRIESVTVYRGQALVTRVVTLPARAGELELVVADLPAQIIAGSLSASGANGVRIRSVRYRTEATAEAVKKEVADLDAQMKQLQLEQQGHAMGEQLLISRSKHLDKLEGFVAPTAQVELSKGVLNAETLQTVSGYIMKQRDTLMAEQLKLYKQKLDLAEKTALVQRKRRELTGGSGRTRRMAMVFVAKPDAAAGTIRLTYLVNAANWSPAYNVRLSGDGKTVTVEYLASVSQASGEDWPGVKLALSTATPAMNAMTPILSPLWMNLRATGGKGAKSVAGLSYGQATQTFADNSASQHQVLNAYNTLAGSVNDANWGLNRIAAERQNVELNVKRDLVQAARTGMADVLAVSYQLPGTMTLPSRSDRQLVQIEALKFAGQAYYEAIPLLSSYVYRYVRVKNETALPLLPGPYSAYLAGDFVGKGSLPLVARGQDVTIGFGTDTQLRCRRELVDKSDKISWGSRIQHFRYRLRLENFKDVPVKVRLIDRIPASKSGELGVSLGKHAEKLSADPIYIRDERARGIMRWDITLAARATGETIRQLDYGFELKYAKDAHVGREATGVMEQMEADFRAKAARLR